MSKAGVEEGPWKPDFLDISISFKKGYKYYACYIQLHSGLFQQERR